MSPSKPPIIRPTPKSPPEQLCSSTLSTSSSACLDFLQPGGELGAFALRLLSVAANSRRVAPLVPSAAALRPPTQWLPQTPWARYSPELVRSTPVPAQVRLARMSLR
jgi:hypothetical protein